MHNLITCTRNSLVAGVKASSHFTSEVVKNKYLNSFKYFSGNKYHTGNPKKFLSFPSHSISSADVKKIFQIWLDLTFRAETGNKMYFFGWIYDFSKTYVIIYCRLCNIFFQKIYKNTNKNLLSVFKKFLNYKIVSFRSFYNQKTDLFV